MAFQRRYRKWCKVNNFESMLPDDTKQRREASEVGQQTALTEHFKEAEVTIPYSAKAFEDAAIEWLVHTNQVCYWILCSFQLLRVSDAL